MIGFHCAHEQFSPADMLAIVQRAEQAGFRAAMCSDHIAPWSERQGHSGAAWPWLGAALASTSIPFGSLAIPGGWRYHPVVLAHNIATLAQMFPGRFPWVAVGSGEAVNERMVGAGWPDKDERDQRLYEGADIMRALWAGQTVTRDQGLIKAEEAKLWSLPTTLPKIYAAAMGEETAEWIGGWADGMITVHQHPDDLHKMVQAFHRGGGKGKALVLQVNVSWAETDEQARLNVWDQWRHTAVPSINGGELRTPQEFDRACRDITPDNMETPILISSDIQKHVHWIREFQSVGFQDIYIHNAGRNQMEFLAAYEREFFPAFTKEELEVAA